jgi:cytidylate kinase
MDQEQQGAPAMSAITISRQYGSGGGEIATRLARRLHWQLIDHEIVAGVAHELRITEEEAAARDEYAEDFVSSVLNAIRQAAPAFLANAPVVPVSPETEADAYREALHHVVETATRSGHVVIVGRGAQVLLARRRDVLHVRVVAPLKQRITYVARREGLDEARAQERIQLKDQDRLRYLQAQHHCHVDDPLLYDIVINTGVLDLESAVELICLALERKARMLRVPTKELGPVAGLTPYPGQPADLRPPSSIIDAERPS